MSSSRTDSTYRVDPHQGTILADSNGISSVIVARTPVDISAMHGYRHATRDAILARLEALVRAVNSYEAMREALRAVVSMHAQPDGNGGVLYRDHVGAMPQARAALALAEGD